MTRSVILRRPFDSASPSLRSGQRRSGQAPTAKDLVDETLPLRCAQGQGDESSNAHAAIAALFSSDRHGEPAAFPSFIKTL